MSAPESMARALARWLCALNLDTVPHSTQEQARRCLLDWLGSAYAGSAHPTANLYVNLGKTLGGEGDHPLVGRPERLPLPFAVLVNGVFGHIAETDDGHRASIMHPGAVCLPVVFALAPQAADPGRAFMEGAIAGYELAIRVGEALGEDHYATWHTTATAGVFGAAAAAAKILGLDEQQTVFALGHAGTQSSGLWQFLEDNCLNAKAFHPGKACMDGLLAACMAQQGIQGAEHIFEGPKGLLAALARPAKPHKLHEGLGSLYKIDEANFKAYPTCGQTHSMLDALHSLMSTHALNPAHIQSIEARVYQRALDVAGITDPKNLEEAKFSLSFCLAHMALFGSIPFTGLDQADVDKPQTRALMARTRVVFDAAMDAGFPAARPCRVSVHMLDGTHYEAENRFRKGDPEKPMDFAELAAKFTQLTQGLLSPAEQRQRIQGIAALPLYDEMIKDFGVGIGGAPPLQTTP